MYLWENRNFETLFINHKLTLRTARQFVKMVCRYYCVRPITLKSVWLGPKSWTAQQLPNRLEVNMDRAIGWNLPLLAHELAHHILDKKLGPDHEAHGALWFGVYLHILDKYRILGADATLPSTRRYGLRVKHPDKCKPGDL